MITYTSLNTEIAEGSSAVLKTDSVGSKLCFPLQSLEHCVQTIPVRLENQIMKLIHIFPEQIFPN